MQPGFPAPHFVKSHWALDKSRFSELPALCHICIIVTLNYVSLKGAISWPCSECWLSSGCAWTCVAALINQTASSFWTVLFPPLLEQQVKSRGKYEAPLRKNLRHSYIYSIKLPILRSLFWKAKWFAPLIIFLLAFVVSFCQEVCHPARPG